MRVSGRGLHAKPGREGEEEGRRAGEPAKTKKQKKKKGKEC